MKHLLDSDVSIVLDSGFLYFPLLFDASIDEEFPGLNLSSDYAGPRQPEVPKCLIKVNGRYFVKAISLKSFLQNYSKLQREDYEQLRGICFKEDSPDSALNTVKIDTKLDVILSEIMPHFMRRKGFKRRKFGLPEIVDMVAEEVGIPEAFYNQAVNLFKDLQSEHPPECFERNDEVAGPSDGLVSSRQLRAWVKRAMVSKALREETERRKALRKYREHLLIAGKRYIAMLLYLAQRGSFERDGFGFHRMGKSNEYVVYKRIGEYALKDFYGNLYLFPPCRVAISTMGYIKPFILDRYKHPFLKEYRENQEICLGQDSEPRRFSTENAIAALEEGINALFYGYNTRKRNGYYSLDTLAVYSHTIRFDDYRIPKNHPKILSGLVEIKNEFI